jgi:hypothetical protein
MVKSNLKYKVTLTCEKRETLKELVRQGRAYFSASLPHTACLPM